MKLALLTAAFVSTIYAAFAFVFGFTTDFTVGAVMAVLSLGAIVWIGHIEDERARAREWREAWAAFDEEEFDDV